MDEKRILYIQELKRQYDNALKLRNIEQILRAGTDYFNELRGGAMYVEDREFLQRLLLKIEIENSNYKGS